jgi:hypothetical protein
MRTINLSQDMIAFVDDDDYERVMAVGKWSAYRHNNTYYASHSDYHDGNQ